MPAQPRMQSVTCRGVALLDSCKTGLEQVHPPPPAAPPRTSFRRIFLKVALGLTHCHRVVGWLNVACSRSDDHRSALLSRRASRGEIRSPRRRRSPFHASPLQTGPSGLRIVDHCTAHSNKAEQIDSFVSRRIGDRPRQPPAKITCPSCTAFSWRQWPRMRRRGTRALNSDLLCVCRPPAPAAYCGLL